MIIPIAMSHINKIPCFLISYNRLTTLKSMIDFLAKEPRVEIIIVDNRSTYPPLLEYLNETPHQVVRMSENFGYKVIWEQNLLQDVNSRYIISDSDLILNQIPDDWFDLLNKGLDLYPDVAKAGFSLDISNLPCDSPVVHHESQFWRYRLDSRFFSASIDTTFALYRENIKVHTYSAIRSDSPYTAIHQPWHITKENITQEEIFYFSSVKTSTHWSAQLLNSLVLNP